MKKGVHAILKNMLPYILLSVLLAPAVSHAQVSQGKYLSYDVWGNPTEVQDAMGVKTAYDWSEDGSMIVGIFTNAQASNVFSHSFAYDGFEGLPNPVNVSNGVATTWSISDGKLKMHHPGNVGSNWSADYLKLSLPVEYSGRTIIEMDVTAGPSSDYSLTVGAGGSSYPGGNGGSENLVWSAFRYGSWSHYNGSWTTIKTGFVEGEVYNLKIIADPITNKVDYYVDGELMLSGITGRSATSGIQSIGVGNYGRSSTTVEWLVDNVRMYPEAAEAVSQEVDPLFGAPVALKDAAGSTRRFVYDGFGRLVASTGPDGGIITENHYVYANVLAGGFGPSAPNIFSSNSYQASIPYNALLGSWSLDGMTEDALGVYHGTSNGAGSDFRAGRFGASAYFSGNGGHISFGSMSDLWGADEFSVSLWFNREADLSSSTMNGVNNVLFTQTGSENNLEIGTDGNYVEVYMKTTGSNLKKNAAVTITNGKWHHLVVTYSESQDDLSIYVDGQNIIGWDSWTGPLSQTSYSFTTIGANYYNMGGYQGLIDEVKVFDKPVNSTEIKAFYESQGNVTYLDGLGREIQSQQRGGNSTLITGTLYNERGLPEVTSRPIEKASQTTYLSTLFNGTGTFTPGGALPGSSPIEDYYQALPSSDEDYAYSQSAYEDSPLGRPLKSTLPGPAHKMGSGREVTSTYGLNTTETFATSAQGSTPAKSWAANELQKTITEDPDGKQTITYTDGWGQTIASGTDMNTDGKLTRGSTDLVTEFSYDLRGNLVRVEDPRGLITSYDYTISGHNPQGQLVEKKLADQTHPHKFRYDKKGRLRFHRDPNQDAASDHYYYTKYDELDRPTETGSYNSSSGFDDITNLNNPGWPTSGHTPLTYHHYDGTNAYSGARNLKGRLTRARYKDLDTGGWGYTWYSYNELGLVEWVVQRLPGLSGDHKIEYSYDALGRVTRVFYNPTGTGNDHYTWYYYDELGRLDEVASHTTSSEGSAQTEAAWSYGADGQPTQLVLGSGAQTVDYLYSVQGWTDQINNPSSMGSDKFANDLYYHYNGNISRQRWEQAGISTSTYNYYYHYDNANRLSEACYGSSTCDSGAFDVTYNYDKNGNLENIYRNRNSGTVDHYNPVYLSGKNIIDYVSFGGTKQFSNDANGNVTVNAIQGITATSYDGRNLPYSVTTGSATMKYAYDAGGNRVRKERVGGTEMHYVRGAGGETVAVYQNGSRAFVNLLAGSEIIGTYDGTQRRYFLKDHLGSVRTTVDASGNVDGYDDYYAFGLVMPGRSSNTGNPNDNYKYTGHERDDEAGLTLDYMGARYYDPLLNRFLSIDPYAAKFPNVSPYVYALNNPVNMWDPDGRAPVGCPACFVASWASLNIYTHQKIKSTAGVNDAEAKVIRQNLHRAPALYGSKSRRNIAEKFAENSGLGGLHNGKGDALRHSLFNAMNTQVLGTELSEELGDAHEVGSPHAVEVEMDLHNNAVGREVGEKFKTATPNQLGNILLNKMKAGELKVIVNGKVVDSSLSDEEFDQIRTTINELYNNGKKDYEEDDNR